MEAILGAPPPYCEGARPREPSFRQAREAFRPKSPNYWTLSARFVCPSAVATAFCTDAVVVGIGPNRSIIDGSGRYFTMSMGRTSLSIVLAASLASCGGGGSSGGGNFGNAPTPTPSPTPTPTTSACALSARQDFAKAVIDEWYLFPSLVDSSVNKASYSTVQGYIDALVAPARAQSRDRFFTYITSIAEENAF